MKKEIVLNGCYGGFGLSETGEKLYRELGGKIKYSFQYDRNDPILIKVIKELGKKADGPYAALYYKQMMNGTNIPLITTMVLNQFVYMLKNLNFVNLLRLGTKKLSLSM